MRTTVMALLGLACLVVGCLLGLLLPGAAAAVWVILAIGAALIAVALALDFARVKSALQSQRGRLGVSASVRISLFAGIILLVNAASVTYYHRFDFTGSAQFTLTSQTKDVLARLEKPVEVVSFFAPDAPITVSGYAKNLLAEYRKFSDQLWLREVDPELDPEQARQFGVDEFGAAYGVVVFRCAGGQRQVFGPQITTEAEHAFTSAIAEVTGVKQKKVYFLTGHGERSISSGYANATQGLRDNLFAVAELDLALRPQVPADAAVVVIAGARGALADSESAILKRYLETNGRLFILLDPDPPREIAQLLSDWWLAIPDGTLVDPESCVVPREQDLLVPKARNAFQLAQTFFPGAAAVVPTTERPKEIEMNALAWTSQKASLPGRPAGSFAIGALVARAPADQAVGGTRLAVIGDSDFASDQNFFNGNNGDLFVSAVNWLAAGKEVVSVDRKVLATRRLLLAPEQARFLLVSSLGLLPLLVLAAGAFVWWRRRSS